MISVKTLSLLSLSVFLIIGPSSQAAAKKPISKIDMSQIKCAFSGKTTTVGSLEFPADSDTVCDPLTSSTAPSFENGLLGKLILKTPQMSSAPKSVLEFHNQGLRMEQNLYFADVNVPTQQFTKGFTTRTGDVLVDGNGVKLIENFAIEYTSSLKLSAADAPGHYEIALLSDDGSRLFIQENNVWNELINNDGVHATRMGCPFRTVYLDRTTEIPIKILYYQGPRFNIANVMMWKLYKKAQAWKEPSRHSLCGAQGNSLFFNENDPSKDTLAMKALKLSGYRKVVSANFKMPASAPNPCTETNLIISEVNGERGPSSATITWKTNFPASSQVRITSTSTGEAVLSQLDSALVNEHTVVITGLGSGQYLVEVISVDANGNQVVSAPPLTL
ncbi:hypothetical protein D3C87_1167400 [compost metagenome]